MNTEYRRSYEVDILIRGWNNLDMTKRLLMSIWRHTDPNRIQVTYVDNGSNRGELLDLMRLFDEQHIQYVAHGFNMGSVRAINVGLTLAALSPAPYVLLMDNDTEIPQGDKTWLDRWLGYMEDETVGAAGAVTDYVAGLQNCELPIDLYQKEWEIEGEGAGLKDPPDIPVLVSFALMIRKAVILKVGLFDEQFEPKNWEDYDYTLRLREAGYRLIVANSIWVHHHGQNKDTEMHERSMIGNQQKFFAKWGKTKLEKMGIGQ